MGNAIRCDRYFNRLICTRLGPGSDNARADMRAGETERQMTDNERFMLLYNLMTLKCSRGKPHKRVPEKIHKGGGYSPRITRLGLPEG